MQKTLTIGRTYAVTTSTSCTVTDSNGTLLTTAYAGQQVVFVAPTSTVTFSDDSATVVAVFKLALAAGSLFRELGGGKLPDSFIPALFLENTGSQYIDTKLQTYSDSVISTTAQQVYASDTNTNSFSWFFGSVQNPGMNIGLSVIEYRYSGLFGYAVVGNRGGNMSVLADVRYDVLNITNTEKQFIINGETVIPNFAATFAPVPDSEITYPIFAYINNSASVGINKGCRIFSFSDTTPSQGGKRLDLVAAIAPDGAPCMFNKVTNQPLVNAGDDSFIVGLTVEQAKHLWKLPANAEKKTLTISLPLSAFVDVETGEIADADVNFALSYAESKGWKITKQFYT